MSLPNEGAPGYTGEGVAGGTDFAVDMEATTEARKTSERPREMGKIRRGGPYVEWSKVLVKPSCSQGYFVACSLCGNRR